MPLAIHYTDAGRSRSKRPKQTVDCSVRSLASTTGSSYDFAYDALKAAGRKSNRGFDIERWARTNTINGRRFSNFQAFPYYPTEARRRYRLSDFLEDHPKGDFIVGTAKHVQAVRDGIVWDDLAWHLLDDRPVYYAFEAVPIGKAPLWEAWGLRRIGKTRTRSWPLLLVPGVTEGDALREASRQAEWMLRVKGDDLFVQPHLKGP